MKPGIPVDSLYLETYTMAHYELQLASLQYGNYLKTIHVQTQPSDELDATLILVTFTFQTWNPHFEHVYGTEIFHAQVVDRCQKLSSLKVLCPLKVSTIMRIKELLPRADDPRYARDFVLKTLTSDFLPWNYDKVLDEIRTNTGWPRHAAQVKP